MISTAYISPMSGMRKAYEIVFGSIECGHPGNQY
jgi:hypothetical protein